LPAARLSLWAGRMAEGAKVSNMKDRTKKIVTHVILTIAGIVVGTIVSGVVSKSACGFNDVIGAIILSPFEMTVGIPLIFYRISLIMGLLTVFGCLVWACSIVLRVKNKRISNYVTVIGAVFWSLGNMPVFLAYMSV